MGSSATTSKLARAATLAVATVAVLWPSRARADEPATTSTLTEAEAQAQAQAAMERGIAAFGKGDAATALFEYEQAMRLVPRANLPYRYAAEALLQLDRPRAAIEHLEKYLAMNSRVSDAAAVRARIESLRRERLPGTLKLDATVPGSQVRIDQGVVRTLPIEVELSPGEHVFVVEHPGRVASTERIHVVGGRTASVTLALGAPILKVPPAAAAPAEGAPALLVTSLATLGLGLVTLGTSAVVDASVLRGKISDLDAASQRGDANLADLKSDASGVRTGVIAGYVAGAVVTVTGGILLLAWQLGRNKGKDAPTVGTAFSAPFVATF